jgi:hypothetical protein
MDSSRRSPNRSCKTRLMRTQGSRTLSKLAALSARALLTVGTKRRSGIPRSALLAGTTPALPIFSAHHRRCASRFFNVPVDRPSLPQSRTSTSTCFRCNDVACMFLNPARPRGTPSGAGADATRKPAKLESWEAALDLERLTAAGRSGDQASPRKDQ